MRFGRDTTELAVVPIVELEEERNQRELQRQLDIIYADERDAIRRRDAEAVCEELRKKIKAKGHKPVA